MTFSAIILTLFPDMFPGPLGQSIAGRALSDGVWSYQTVQIRDFAADKYGTVDDKPYGGGVGMVMKPDVLDRALTHAKSLQPSAEIIYFTPRGAPMTQGLVAELAQKPLILLCGRFEGVDERVIAHHRMREVSLGDFVLAGGEIPALALLDAIIRLLPGVLKKDEAWRAESFSKEMSNLDPNSAGLLEYPHYTRPPIWNGLAVPEVLLNGNHAQIDAWRREQALLATAERRPDLLQKNTKD